ncbi:hypothetical protein C1646_666339 [Rhizophagus diaphanus]|nr:hypothetical protein C1646_666339 [Rhizophagus diaphanus] [Rhizophagus sp. MUCL 43196]
MDKLQAHVLQGKREKIKFGLSANERESDIQKCLVYVIRKGTPIISDAGTEGEGMELPDFEIDTMITLKEGIKAHKNRDYEKAWKCFEYHALNGSAYAKYWMGYYL